MKSLIQFTLAIISFGLAVSPASAAFSSLYIFGDSLSTATTNLPVGPDYYGDRYSNGRVWVEDLAQLQGLPNFNVAKNTSSYWGNTSSDLVGEVNKFNAPDASKALVVIWVNNADLYFPATATPPTLLSFNAVINKAQISHYNAITNLYAKGFRNLIMPNVVDISAIPAFNNYTAYTNLLHQASTNYNAAFYATINRATNSRPDLHIYVPDFYTLLTDLIAHPADYGVTNALKNGLSIDALGGLGKNASLTNGAGTNYIFWGPNDPTAMVHYIMAKYVQQLISPVQIGLTALNGSNRLDVINAPVGVNGFVDGSTNLASASWTLVTNFNSTTPSQSIYVVAPPLPADFGLRGSGSGSGGGGSIDPNQPRTNTVSTNVVTGIFSVSQFYRLRFPYVWNWP